MPIIIFVLLLVAVSFLVRSITRRSPTQVGARKFMAAGDQLGWSSYASLKDGTAIAIHPTRHLVLLGKKGRYKDYPWRAITSVEVLKDGVSISHTNKGSLLTGAVVGGALFGVVGAAVGARSASTRVDTRVTSVVLKVIVDDPVQPIHLITFYRSYGGKLVGGSVATSQWPEAEHFHALLINAMRNAAAVPAPTAPAEIPAETPAATPALAPPPAENFEKRLSALWELKVAGALTDAEFQAQKASLLAPAPPSA